MTPPRVLGLVRVSTDEQADSGAGMDAQRAALEDAAQRNGWALELIVEDGVSGKEKAKRPKLDAALARLDAHEADMLAVAKLDRLCRSTIVFGPILQRAKDNGWAITVLDFGMDTSTTNGKMMAQILMVLAEWERDTIADRTRAALAARKRDGMVLGRPAADHVPDEVRARIRAERAAGLSLRAICNTLDRDGVPTAQGGKRWHPGVIAQVLDRHDTAV